MEVKEAIWSKKQGANKMKLGIKNLIIISAVAILMLMVLIAGRVTEVSDNTNTSITPDTVSVMPTPTPAPSPTRVPLESNKTWFTQEEMLNAFGPAPTPIPDNATTTVLLNDSGKLYPYPNGSMSYYTDYAGAKDPTTDQLVAFLITDDTYTNKFVPGQFVCVNFAVMLHDHAESRGIKAHMASVLFTSGPESDNGHMINAFNTTDAGWVLVDATGPASDGGVVGCVLIDGSVHSGDKYKGILMRMQDGKWGLFNAETGDVVEGVDII